MLPSANHTIHSTCRTQDSTSSQLGFIAAAYGLPNDTIPTRNQEPRLHNPTRGIASRYTQLSDTAGLHSLTSTIYLDRSPPKTPHNQASSNLNQIRTMTYQTDERSLHLPKQEEKFATEIVKHQTTELSLTATARLLNSEAHSCVGLRTYGTGTLFSHKRWTRMSDDKRRVLTTKHKPIGQILFPTMSSSYHPLG